jgi:tetratricopeptide (TPR) repeat protein
MQTSQVTTQRGQIFISYSRRDTPAVGRLYSELKRARYNLWMDTTETGIQIGSNWRVALEENVHASAAMIACYSPDFFASPFCKAEIAQALAEKKPIFPVLLRALAPEDEDRIAEFGLKDIQYGDLTKEEFWQPSLKKLKRHLPPPDWLGWLARYGGYIATAALASIILIIGLRASDVQFLGQVFGFTPPIPTAIPVITDARVGVAVAYFERTDEAIDDGQARVLVDHFAGDMRQAIQSAAEENGLALGFLSPSEFNRQPIEGSTPLERRNSARQYATGRGVDMVIYGWIDRDEGGRLKIHPEFTLIPEDLSGADELASGNRFGKLILAPAQGSATEAERELSHRAHAAAQIAAGLALLATGEMPEYEKALNTFQTVLNDYKADEIDAVTYVLLGNTHLRMVEQLWHDCSPDIRSHIEAAIGAYEMANELDDAYSRSYSGLSVAHFQFSRLKAYESTGDCYLQAYDLDELNLALSYVEQANAVAADTQEDSDFVNAVRAANEVRVTYALCALHLSGEVRAATENCTRFEHAADRIIDDADGTGIYDRTGATMVLPYAAMIEAARGSLAYLESTTTGEYDKALDAYTRAITLLEQNPTTQNRFQQMLDYSDRADVHLTYCELAPSADDFETASKIADSLSLLEAVDYYLGLKAFALDSQSNGCAS